MHWLGTLLNRLYGLYAISVCVICVPIAAIVVLITPGFDRRRRAARFCLRAIFFLGGLPVHVTGLDKVPEQPSVAIANHRSYLDGLVAIAALPIQFTPVIKAGVSHVPLLALVLRRVGARYLERGPEAAAGRDTRHLLDALSAGESLCMFPEGTFSIDGGLLPFHPGAFFLAVETDAPIVPVAIRGTRRALPSDAVLPRVARLQVHVLDPLKAEKVDCGAADDLRDRAEDALWEGLQSVMEERPQPGQAPDYDYYRRLFRDRTLPFAFVDLDLLERNIHEVLARSGGKRLRVDASALRCPDLIDRVLRSHIRFQGVKCATVEEAVWLATRFDLEDVLVAYPTLQANAMERACQAAKDGCEITLAVDSKAQLRRLARAAESAEVTLPVCVELDMSRDRRGLGHASRRSAVRTSDELLALAEAIAGYDHLRFRGLLVFDTQATDRLDRPASNRDDGPWQALRQRRREVLERLEAQGHAASLVSGGGDGSIEFNAFDPSITEINVGSVFYGNVEYGDSDGGPVRRVPAAGYAAEIIRRPDQDVYVCPGDALSRPYLPRGAVLDKPAGAGEAQIPVRYTGDLRLGDPLFMRYAGAGELCERFSSLLLVQNGAVVDSVRTYRGLSSDRSS